VKRLLEEAECLHIPFVVLGELRAGFSLGKKGPANERVLQRFLAKPGVEILYPTDATTRSYASLYRQLREQGTPIPTNDLWIAALVVENDLVLCTRDGHFRYLPQLNLV
jgi:tRNA(fMet)-specific endonuclease VapC